MENLLAAVRDQIPALREGSTAENTLSAGTETAETDTAKQIRIRDREQKEGRQNRRSRELRKIKRMELKKMEWKSRSRSRRKQESQNRQPESRHQRQNPKRRSLSRRRPLETGGAPREILYPEADTIQETISPDLLADPQALLNRFFVVDPNTSVLPGEIDGSTLLGKDLTLPENAEGPQILIYHTHSQEPSPIPSGRKSGHGNRPR